MVFDLGIIAVASLGAVAAGYYALDRPVRSLGILFLLASFSRLTVETPLGTMRPEMPAIAVVAIVLARGGRLRELVAMPRTSLIVLGAFASYLGVLTLSSATAPDRSQSLHMVAWYAASMLGGVEAFVLARSRPSDATVPLTWVASFMAAAGIVTASIFLVTGPTFATGIQDGAALLPRVYAFAWEANLYAIFLAAGAFLALDVARQQRRFGLLALALIVIGMPLGITRVAYLALAAGLVAYVGAMLLLRRSGMTFVRVGSAVAGGLALGLFATFLLLPNPKDREARAGWLVAIRPAASAPGATLPPGYGPGSSTVPSAVQSPTPSPAPTPEPVSPDTIAFRLERVPIALEELPQSPLIGFGAEAFGQRHPDRYNGPNRDHISIMAVAVVYETGLLGTGALAIGFGVLIWELWRRARSAYASGDSRTAETAVAFIACLVALLVAYQANNALQLAVTWIVLGVATAITALPRLERGES